MKKEFVIIFLLVMLAVFVSSQTVVQVEQGSQEQEQSYLSKAFSFLKSPLVITIIILLVISVIFLIISFFIVKWVIQFIKTRNDVFYKIKKERVKLARTHKRYPVNHWWKVEKNTPVRLVKKENGRLVVTSPIGYYKGDYLSPEGNVVISMNVNGYKFWWFFPTTEVLIIPNRESIEVKSESDRNKAEKKIMKYPLAKDIVQFNDDEVLIFAEGISHTGMFFVPVVKSKNGETIDLTLPTYDSMKNVMFGEYLYEQTTSFSQLAKKSMEINPFIRSTMKLSDASQSVEVPSQREQK